MNPVFVAGGTGYLGRPFIEELLARGCEVHALDATSFCDAIPAGTTIVHLVGTPHPSPAKAAEFLSVDLASTRAATTAATEAGAAHFVYVSVAHPAPMMKAYIAARVAGEALVSATGISATILRPWYVLGPGHRWPYVLVPFYAILRAIPATRASAARLGLVSHREMISALVRAVATAPTSGVRTVEVPGIRSGDSG